MSRVASGRPLIVTQGEPAGIGPELVVRAWENRGPLGLPVFAVCGDPELYRRTAARLRSTAPVVDVRPEEAAAAFEEALPVIPTGCPGDAEPGKPEPRWASGVIAAIDQAVGLVQEGRAGAVVTSPIAKAVLYEAGFSHPGHTEYLAALSARLWAIPEPRPVMMIWSPDLAVVPTTIHVPLKDVPGLLTPELIIETGRIVDRDMRERFGIATPRIAVAGLNPHAGESGTIGREDEAVVRPAVVALRALGIEARGPLPADTLFHARARAGYDVALCMYHDQALIPVKALAFDEGVNVTLGLPFVRTSPDHGTAFDIAGRGVARTDSMAAALRLAARLASPPAPAEAGA